MDSPKTIIVLKSPEFIKFLKATTLETGAKISSFWDFTCCKIPQVLGVIDGTCTEILEPCSGRKLNILVASKIYC